jgi:hypothetical protein
MFSPFFLYVNLMIGIESGSVNATPAPLYRRKPLAFPPEAFWNFRQQT